MASTTVSGTTVRNDGGIVLQGGAVSENLTDLSLISNAADVPGYGTIVTEDTPTAPNNFRDPHGVTKVKSGGTFAYTPPAGSEFLLMAAGDTNAGKINGSSSSLLTIPGGAVGQVINKSIKTVQFGTYATRAFNVLAVPSSGNFPGLTRGSGAGTAVTYASTSGNYPAVDDAATTSRAVPGELTYRFGAALPTRNVAYKAKDSNE
jgi:hypothetical protein